MMAGILTPGKVFYSWINLQGYTLVQHLAEKLTSNVRNAWVQQSRLKQYSLCITIYFAVFIRASYFKNKMHGSEEIEQFKFPPSSCKLPIVSSLVEETLGFTAYLMLLIHLIGYPVPDYCLIIPSQFSSHSCLIFIYYDML